MKQQTGKPKVLGLVFLIVFLDIVGFSILFPLFPAILEHYVGREGPESLIGRFAGWLRDFAGDNETAVFAFFGGALGTLYSALQFLFAPVWGGLSDRIGRRPTLLITLAGTVAAYGLWFFAGSFSLLIASRLLGGVAAGNISTASAVVADTTEGKQRATGMGILGMGIGLGFVFGPALGALTAGFDLTESLPSWVAYGVNPFSSAALLALVLGLINLLWVAARFPETLPAGGASSGEGRRALNPFAALSALKFPGVPRTNLLYFLYLVAFSAIEFTLVFLAVERFDFGPKQNAWMFVFVGLTIAFVQGGLVRRLAPRLGERKLALAGLALTIPGFAIVGTAHSVPALYAGLGFMAVGSAFVMPSLSALVSRYSPAENQGLALGTFRSMGSLSRAAGPILGGLVFWRFGSTFLYVAGAVFLALPLALALRLPPVQVATEDDGANPAPGA